VLDASDGQASWPGPPWRTWRLPGSSCRGTTYEALVDGLGVDVAGTPVTELAGRYGVDLSGVDVDRLRAAGVDLSGVRVGDLVRAWGPDLTGCSPDELAARFGILPDASPAAVTRRLGGGVGGWSGHAAAAGRARACGAGVGGDRAG
jgi:hypothetical protein